MKPSALPEFRARVVSGIAQSIEKIDATKVDINHATTSELREARLAVFDKQVRLSNLVYGQTYVHSHWRLGELFYVTAEMAAVASQAADTMPAFDLHPDDLPSEFGVLYFELPSGEHTPIVSLWGPDHSGDPGDVLVSTFSDDTPETLLITQSHIRYGSDLATHTSEAGESWTKIVRCTWLLMQQRIAAETRVMPDRSSGRRLKRVGADLNPVRVLSLRRAQSHSEGGSSREFVHRWVVRGHWRRQWYSSQQRHVPIWISPFIKGPDDAPLLGGEKVYAWTK